MPGGYFYMEPESGFRGIAHGSFRSPDDLHERSVVFFPVFDAQVDQSADHVRLELLDRCRKTNIHHDFTAFGHEVFERLVTRVQLVQEIIHPGPVRVVDAFSCKEFSGIHSGPKNHMRQKSA